MPQKLVRLALALTLSTLLGACAVVVPEPAWKKAVAGDGPGDPSLLFDEDLVVQNLPKSRSGNRSEYEVFGTRYRVLDSAKGFVEQGVASWYGSKFHGRATASGEIYDMHRLTAAHKHLPLPTFVRVTRLDNQQSIVVKVNDRGPFVGDRIIDLSYGAALRLGMLDGGKARVRVEALSHHGEQEQVVQVPASLPVAQYVQAGAFSESANAQALLDRLDENTGLPLLMDYVDTRQLYRVRVGPLPDEQAVTLAMQTLASSGIRGYRISSGW